MADRHVFWVQLATGYGPDARRFGVAFETTLPSVEAVAHALGDRGIVAGQRLFLTDDGEGGRLITGRQPYAFGVAMLINVQNYLHAVRERT